MDPPWITMDCLLAVHGMPMDPPWTHDGLSKDCPWTHGLSMNPPWTRDGPTMYLPRTTMNHHRLSMDHHGPPWTVHGTTMDCPWIHHRLFMGRPWTHRGPPWTHGLSIELPWASTDRHELSTDHHGLGTMGCLWTVHGLFMDPPGTTIDCPWNHHGLSTDRHGPPWTVHPRPLAL